MGTDIYSGAGDFVSRRFLMRDNRSVAKEDLVAPPAIDQWFFEFHMIDGKVLRVRAPLEPFPDLKHLLNAIGEQIAQGVLVQVAVCPPRRDKVDAYGEFEAFVNMGHVVWFPAPYPA